ncbi:phosphoglycerate kinase, putative [Theileria equi strain WA]|uniref:Phosphoglycerate kinase n=1 Tax=Theileria equi strain WA TaxID=1537102 RepID=L1LFJ1_THEEQ|nr:phosphoglycerate kinase, putative [Theileria equi strain WA]EKX74121.1 phosphoglycerate kinase, putative [Theileria equi strain WA]|eukprot:XP_004833573.1 phosphoglycerate kinase, putative [Theileria equi strain WA]
MESLLSSKFGLSDVVDQLPGKRVLMRVDFNVPIKEGVVTDATRIKATVPTIKFLLDHGVKSIVLMSHCGRPDGQRVEKYTLKPVVPELSSLLGGHEVKFLDDCVGEAVEAECKDPKPGSIILLENLRFHPEEESKDQTAESVVSFRSSLTKLGDIYVNDAFGTAHRAHSSIVGVDLPLRVAGHLMKRELDYFAKALENPQRPFVSILGGAKVRDKIKLIMALIEKVDALIIGGGMAYTFKKVLNGMPIGESLFDEESVEIIGKIVEKCKQFKVDLHLPVDFKVTTDFSNDTPTKFVDDSEGVPDGWMGLDCGPKTVEAFGKVLGGAKTIVWNGPLGVFEFSNFAAGSTSVLDLVIEATKGGATSIIGGGDTAALAEQTGRAKFFSHVSTGGGASLELLEGKVLPGVSCLTQKS